LNLKIKTAILISLMPIASGALCRAQGTAPPATPPTAAPAGHPAAGGVPEEYSIILEKNIFGYLVTAGASPPLPAEPAMPRELGSLPVSLENTLSQPEKTQSLSLTAVVQIGDVMKAVLEDKAAALGYYVQAGDTVNEYIVKSIDAFSAILESSGGTLELRIEENSAAPEQSATEQEKGDKQKGTVDTPEMIPFPQRGRAGGR